MKLRYSLKQALTLKFILLATLPLFLFAFFTVKIVTGHLNHEIRTKNLLLSRALAGEVERFLNEPLSLLNHIKSLMENENLIRPDQISEYLNVIIRHYDYFSAIQILGERGVIRHITPYNPDYIGADMSGQPHYQKSTEIGRPYWSPTFISQLSGQPTMTLSIPFQNGTIVGYLKLETLNRMTDKIRIESNGYAVICDQTGVIIAHRDRSFVQERLNVSNLPLIQKGLAGKEGTFQYRFRGVDKLGSIAIVPQTGWVVGFVQPVEEAFLPITQIRKIFWIGILLSAALGILLLLLSLAKTLRPLTRLMGYAESIEAGNYGLPTRLDSYTEINGLSNHLHRMAQAVQTRETALEESRKALARSKADLESAQHLAKLGSWSYDPDTNIFTLSDPMDRILGRSPDSPRFVLETFFQRIHPEDREECVRLFQDALEKGRDYERIFRFSIEDGTYRHIQTLVACQQDEQGKVIRIFGTSQDITEQKQRERERETLQIRLHHAQKMEAVGTLTGGIAHEFNNLLFPIIGYTEMVMEELPESSLMHKHLREVIIAAKRARDSVRQLLSFTHNSPSNKRKIRIDTLVEDVLKSMKKEIPPNIEIQRDLSLKAPEVTADAGQIHQALKHLCTNALHAMRQSGGVLTVSVSETSITPASPWPDGIRAGIYTLVSIRDTGHGMDAAVIKRVFDPYFTTREVGEGSGLGLSVAYGIIRSHGGYIRVQSEPGAGSSFEVLLPAFPDQTANAEQCS